MVRLLWSFEFVLTRNLGQKLLAPIRPVRLGEGLVTMKLNFVKAKIGVGKKWKKFCIKKVFGNMEIRFSDHLKKVIENSIFSENSQRSFFKVNSRLL